MNPSYRLLAFLENKNGSGTTWKQEEPLRWNKKAFFIILEALSLKQLKKTIFSRGESDFVLVKTVLHSLQDLSTYEI